MLLNLFGGPAANAAQGIAAQVNGAAYSFVSNFMTVVDPQITRASPVGIWEPCTP